MNSSDLQQANLEPVGREEEFVKPTRRTREELIEEIRLLVSKIRIVLSSHFTNGFRLESKIELTRFRKFFVDEMGVQDELSDDDFLKLLIRVCGFEHNGKVFMVSEETKKRIGELGEDYFSSGAEVIFYSEFFSKNEDWLIAGGVVSEEILKKVFKLLLPHLPCFKDSYFGQVKGTIPDVIEREILRVWGDNVLMTYEQLAERLPYIPIARIKSALGQNPDFIWNSLGTFSHTSRIEITNQEKLSIIQAACQEIGEHGYVSATNLPLGEIRERNHELSIHAVCDAVYRICLTSKDTNKQGKIITLRSSDIDLLTIMKDYCRTLDRCSLEDLKEYEKELTGAAQNYSLEAASSVLVRIDENTFVADRFVHFDTKGIDESIDRFVTGDYLPLRSFTTFAVFPNCGQRWNLFLLESYCRRFSKTYRLEGLSVNSRNVGAVVRTSCELDYIGVMSDAVVNADIPIESSAVAQFLRENGYLGRCTEKKVNEIIDRVKTLRQRGD